MKLFLKFAKKKTSLSVIFLCFRDSATKFDGKMSTIMFILKLLFRILLKRRGKIGGHPVEMFCEADLEMETNGLLFFFN
jgi:hypothetical protein